MQWPNWVPFRIGFFLFLTFKIPDIPIMITDAHANDVIKEDVQVQFHVGRYFLRAVLRIQ